ncbi:MAG: DUF6491 family protein [Pseudomonadota bacterium]
MKPLQTLKLVLFILGIASLAACAGYDAELISPTDESLLTFTDEPVDEITFSQLVDWYGYNRDYLVLRFNRQQWFALKVMEPCVSDVRQARSLQLDTVLSTRLGLLDRVVVDGRSCRIDELRPLDHDAFRESRDEYLKSLGQH